MYPVFSYISASKARIKAFNIGDMTMKQLLTKYTNAGRLFHWLTAFLVVGMFATVWIAEDASDDMGRILMGIHKSFGMIILVLVTVRIIWRFVSPKLEPIKAARLMRVASHAVHGLLYVLLLVMPLLGWAFVSAKGRQISFFNVVDVPMLIEKNPSIARTLIEGHSLGADILMVLVGVHVLAALYHQFFLKDKLIERMLP